MEFFCILLTKKNQADAEIYVGTYGEISVIQLVANPCGVSQVNHRVDEGIGSVLETLVPL